ncbi:MAG: hypothetical protein LBQ59_00140 [Candidatus Peribacteria bacterium]|nr:hypothetical protein [Candidatus Peribacteria bacterium]
MTSSQIETEFLFTFKSTIGVFTLSHVSVIKYLEPTSSEFTLASLLSFITTTK